eukprot:snap_masked-scaffold_11-processed-gene-8.16-mRNA-1 protein AED:1.00 eAED:1.00 QI:0/-1/0/0/-1/1/1/0/156
MSIPLFKMGTLLIKTISKPLATNLKSQAKQHPKFRKVCVTTGQFMNRIQTEINVRSLGHKVKKIKPLNEEIAINKGADLFGDVFIYTVSALTIIWEVNRRSNETKEKAEKALKEKQRLDDEREEVQESILNLIHRQERLEEEVMSIKKLLLQEKKE